MTTETRNALREMAQGKQVAHIEVGSIGGGPGEAREDATFVAIGDRGVSDHAMLTLDWAEQFAASLLLTCDALRVARSGD